MFARHMCSGRPVLADCAWTNSSGVCVPSPIGSVAVHVQLAGSTDTGDQVVDRDLAQRVAGALRLSGVTLNQPAVGAADAGNRLAGREVHDLVDLHAGVGFAPTQNW